MQSLRDDFPTVIKSYDHCAFKAEVLKSSKEKYLLVVVVKGSTSMSDVESLCRFHKEALEVHAPSSNRFNISFVYDLRTAQYKGVVDCFMPFIQFHGSRMEEYSSRLYGTVVIIDNDILCRCVQGLLQVFKPTRPLRFAACDATMVEALTEIGAIRSLCKAEQILKKT